MFEIFECPSTSYQLVTVIYHVVFLKMQENYLQLKFQKEIVMSDYLQKDLSTQKILLIMDVFLLTYSNVISTKGINTNVQKIS